MAEHEMIPGTEETQFFEGVEKLLEIWFTRDDGRIEDCDLRKIPRKMLEDMLRKVHCEIISSVQNDQLDSYVLSESSMFVSQRRFILKTCGTTTPLQCLMPLLLLVNQYAGFDTVADVYYSRKNFKRPELQHKPHGNFEEEVTTLDSFFKDGAAYCMGSVNRDCWYLYTLHPLRAPRHPGPLEPDQTVEIMMSDLDPKIMSIFTREECSSAAEATLRSGIDKLLPGMIIDDYLFEPHGYSMNGISKTEDHYMTIHITPEPDFSYVSFESNIPLESYKDVIMRVVKTFRPGKFVLTVFANKTSVAANAPRELEKEASFGELLRNDVHYCRFKSYDLTYALYSKFPS